MNYKLKDNTTLVSANVSTVRQIATYFPESKPALERLFPKVFEEEERVFKAGTKFKHKNEDDSIYICYVR